MNRWVKLDDWVREILVDPFGKGPLEDSCEYLKSTYGMVYPKVGEIIDFRRREAGISADASVWKAGQAQYEAWSRKLIEDDQRQDYFAEIEGVREVYREIPVTGRVLDVGGHQGRLREFLHPDQEYLSCDPFLNVFDGIDRQVNLLKAYKGLHQPCNFVAAHAEHLPLDASAFDTVHMRSVVDHFRDPSLAMIEAFRVLRQGGKVIVGLMVEGGKSGRQSVREHIKEGVRAMLPWVGVTRFNDYHVWHPTYAELIEMIEGSGFEVRKVHWQKGWNDRVCYVEAMKPRI